VDAETTALTHFAEPGEQHVRALVPKPGGGAKLAGTFYGQLDVGSTTLVSSAGGLGPNVMLLDLDESGAVVEATQVNADRVSVLHVDVDGSTYLGGNGILADTLETDRLGWLRKYDASGEVAWTRQWQGNGSPVGVAVHSDGSVYFSVQGFEPTELFGSTFDGHAIARWTGDEETSLARGAFGYTQVAVSGQRIGLVGTLTEPTDVLGVTFEPECGEADVIFQELDRDLGVIRAFVLGTCGWDQNGAIVAHPDGGWMFAAELSGNDSSSGLSPGTYLVRVPAPGE
jgi:hypothetical protein